MSTTEYAKVITYDESTIHTSKVSELMNGDVILVPGKGKRAVRQHTNGKLTLVFPKSGLPTVDGKKAGSLAELGQHAPAIVGRVTGGWVGDDPSESTEDGTVTPKAPKAAKRNNGAPAKGSAEAKERMAKVRAARKSETAAPAPKAGKPSSNAEHFAKALAALGEAIEHLTQVEVA